MKHLTKEEQNSLKQFYFNKTISSNELEILTRKAILSNEKNQKLKKEFYRIYSKAFKNYLQAYYNKNKYEEILKNMSSKEDFVIFDNEDHISGKVLNKKFTIITKWGNKTVVDKEHIRIIEKIIHTKAAKNVQLCTFTITLNNGNSFTGKIQDENLFFMSSVEDKMKIEMYEVAEIRFA